MPKPMRVVGSVVEHANGSTALFQERTRAMMYAQTRAAHQQCSVEDLVVDKEAFRYAMEWIRERLPHGMEEMIDNWNANVKDV